MSEILNNLNNDYKQMKKEATLKEEKQQIKQDYKEMKGLLKGSNKLLKEAEQDQKKWDKIWDKFDKEYEKLGEAKEKDRSDYFTYKQGDIQFGNSQCVFCKYSDATNLTRCINYPNGKPENIINMEVKCKYLENIGKIEMDVKENDSNE